MLNAEPDIKKDLALNLLHLQGEEGEGDE